MLKTESPLVQLLDMDEMAAYLKVSKKTLYHWVSRRQIPFTKVGRHVRFEPTEVVSYFRNRTQDLAPPCYTSPLLIRTGSRSLTTRQGSQGGTRKE